jgi:hypothetical protein
MIALLLTASSVSVLLTLAVPVLTAVVTKAAAPAKVKAVVSIVLAAVATLVSSAVDGTGQAVLSGPMFTDWLVTTAVAVASYLGFYKPVLSINDRLIPRFGLGKS